MGYLADYESAPLQIKDGEGTTLIDVFGRRYIDFAGGWCVGNVGWKRKEVLDAIKKEAERGIYVPPFLRFKDQEKLAKLLCMNTPGKLKRAFRCTSGSEAVEFALKCARATTGKSVIVSIDGVYHGHTYGAASVGDACRESMEPCLPEMKKLPMPNQENVKEVLVQFEGFLKQGNVAAFLSEPVWSNAGVYIPPKEFYPSVQKLCRKYGTLLVMDEVATGFGRCGKLFASELWNIEPDIMCLGKGLTGGYAAAGATLTTEEVFKKSRGIPSYSTFGWVPLATAAIIANIEVILKEKLSERAEEFGGFMLGELKELEKLKSVKEVRGIGMLFGVELKTSTAYKALLWCGIKGLILEATDRKTLFLSPALILDKETALQGISMLRGVLKGL